MTSEPSLEIRRLHASDDRLAVSGIYEASWKYAYRDILPREYLESIPAGRWVSGLDFSDRIHLVMLDGGRYIGAACCCASRFPEFTGWGEIVSLYLLPEYMGRGYGRPLLEAAVAALCARGYEKVFLWVLEENRRARGLYERAGFRYGGISREDVIGGRALRELAYCRADRDCR